MKSNQDLLVSYREDSIQRTQVPFFGICCPSIHPSTEVLLSCSSTFSHHPAQPFISSNIGNGIPISIEKDILTI